MVDFSTLTAQTAPWVESIAKVIDKSKTAQGGLSYANRVANTYLAPIATHRLKSITGAFLGFFGGEEIMNILAGQKPDGTPIPKSDVPDIAHPFHGVLSYNRYSDDPKDRWLHVLHVGTPAIVAAIGYYLGSTAYIENEVDLPGRTKNLNSVSGASAKVDFERSKPYGMLAAVSALFGSASGFTEVWLGNTSAFMNNRFPLGCGRSKDFIIPGRVGRWLSKTLYNNHGPFFARGGLAAELKENLINNPRNYNPLASLLDDKAPILTREYLNTIFHTFFEKVTPEHLDEGLKILDSARVSAFKSGVDPDDVLKQMNSELGKILEGEGLMKFFKDSGLNINEFQLDRVGLIGRISKFLGKIVGQKDLASELATVLKAPHVAAMGPGL